MQDSKGSSKVATKGETKGETKAETKVTAQVSDKVRQSVPAQTTPHSMVYRSRATLPGGYPRMSNCGP